MELSSYVSALQADLERSVAAAGTDAQRLGGLLAGALEPAARLAIMDALSAAAAEISAAVHGVRVELRLTGRNPDIVVTSEDSAAAPPSDDGSETSRITLRLPEGLKNRVEDRAARDGVSVNSWLVRAIRQASEHGNSSGITGQTLRGYARG
jgi:Arc-like DNA binding dprotein